MNTMKLFLGLSLVVMVLVGLATEQAIAAKSFVTDGLISYWTFDKKDVKGDIAKDIIGKNDGTIKGDVNLVAGKIGDAISCDGATNLVEVPINDDLSREGTDTMTVEAWLNVEKPAFGVICGRDYWILHWSTEGALPAQMTYYVGVGGWKSVNSQSSVKDGWHHWAGVYDGKNMMVYLDGKKDGSSAMSGKIAPTGDGHAKFLSFGKDYHTSVNNGRWNKVIIDEVKIYKKALSDAEIAQNFSADSNSLAVDNIGKLSTTWGDVKYQH